MWNILICDDDSEVLSSVSQQVKKCASSYINRIILFIDPNDLINFIRESSEDQFIVILDIELNSDENGISTARIIQEISDVQIIFITGYIRYFEKVYDVERCYFLNKPLKDETLLQAILTAGRKLNEYVEKHIMIIKKDSIIKISKSHILFVETKNRGVTIYYDDKTQDYNVRMDKMEKILGKGFIRCHKSYIVNRSKIGSLDTKKSLFILNDNQNTKIPISRSCFNESKQNYLNYCAMMYKQIKKD